jgi:hypothetical protein
MVSKSPNLQLLFKTRSLETAIKLVILTRSPLKCYFAIEIVLQEFAHPTKI